MSSKLTFLACAAATLSAARAQDPQAMQKELKELKQRVEELEDQSAKTSERLGSRAVAQAYTAKSLDFGGHVSSLFTYIDGEGGSEAGHMVTMLELFLKAQLDDQWSLFATPGFYTFNGALLDNPVTASIPGDPTFTPDQVSEAKTFLSRIYGQWKYSDSLQLQGGIVGSPHGTTNREYFIPARTIAQASLHTRIFLVNTIYPQIVEGLRASGKLTLGGGTDWLDYDAYFGTEDDSPGDGIGGGRLAYVFGDLGLSLAANFAMGTREAAASPATNFGVLQSPFAPYYFTTRDYQVSGIDLDWRQGDFINKTEAYYSAEDGYDDQYAISTETSWFFDPKWAASYRFDYFDRGSDLNPFLLAVAPLGHATEHVLGLCYNPNNSVRLRLDLHHLLLPGTDDTVDYVNLSWSISF